MVETIIDTIDLSLQSIYPTAKYYGLARRENNGEEQTIFKYKGYGSNDYVGFDDTYPINVYHRIIGVPETSDLNSGFGTSLLRQTTYNMRLVVFGDMRKINDNDCDINYTIAPQFSAKIPNRINQNILDLIGVKSTAIQATRTEYDRPTIFNGEMTGVDYKLHPENLLFSIDYNIRVNYDPNCVVLGCEPIIPKVTVIDGSDTIELTAPSTYTCSLDCDPATVTATNSLSTVLGTVSAPSGGTGNIPISDSAVNKSDGTLIANVPAETNYNVADSVITVEYADGTPISTTNVKATDAALIEVPNPPACPTLDDLVDSSSVTDVVTAVELAGKECSVRSGLVDKYPNDQFSGGSFGSFNSAALSVFVNGNIIYVLNNTQIDLYDATTLAYNGSVLGFTRVAEIAFSDTTYAVADFGASAVSIRNITDNIEVINFPVITGPFSICFNDTFTLVYVATFNAAGSLEVYNTLGVSQGSVSGFDARIIEIRAVGTEYWVLTAIGTSGANTQRVRKMRFSDNTQVSTNSLGTVATIGAIRAMVVVDTTVYISTALGNQNVYQLISYELDFTGQVTYLIGLVATNAYGLTHNSNSCNDLIMILPEAGRCYNIQL